MPPNSEALRALLKQYIGPAYDRALRNTGSEERARDATRRAMELLKRSYEMGVEPNKALVLRITDDCCNESAFYNRQVTAPAPQSAPAPSAAKAQAPAPRAAQTVPVPTAPLQAEFLPTAPLRAAPAPATRARATAQDAVVSNPPAQEKHKKAALQPQDRVSPGSALLVMALSLIVVVLVIMLVVMLASVGSSPAAAAGEGSGFSAWFNAHIFPLF